MRFQKLCSFHFLAKNGFWTSSDPWYLGHSVIGFHEIRRAQFLRPKNHFLFALFLYEFSVIPFFSGFTYFSEFPFAMQIPLSE